MSEIIEFVIHGEIDGKPITPSTINFTQFNEFNRQVERFMMGTDAVVGDRLQLDSVGVEVVEGSYALRLIMGVAMVSLVTSKMTILEADSSLSKLDKNRAEVVEKWQSTANKFDDLFYEIRVVDESGTPLRSVRISSDTNFKRVEDEAWVPVETYLLGQIRDAGGERPNIHIKLEDSGETLIVQTDEKTLAGLERNPLFKRALLRVEGEQSVRSRQFRNLHLREFVNYKADYDEVALDRFIRKSSEAWADVTDPAEWLRELRGG